MMMTQAGVFSFLSQSCLEVVRRHTIEPITRLETRGVIRGKTKANTNDNAVSP